LLLRPDHQHGLVQQRIGNDRHSITAINQTGIDVSGVGKVSVSELTVRIAAATRIRELRDERNG
jgi:hypothetical protein